MSEERMTEDARDVDEQLTVLPTSIEAALMPSNRNIMITEPDEPFRIVHVNEAWCRSCGFDAEDVLGQTCRVMQGPGTCRATLKLLRQALLMRRQFAVQLLNFSKQGRPFMNTLQVGPLFSDSGHVTHFIGVVLARYLDGGTMVPPSVQLNSTPAMRDGLIQPSMAGGDSNLPMKRRIFERDMGDLEHPTMHGADDGDVEHKYNHQDDGSSVGRVPPFLTKLCEILTAEAAEIVTVAPENASFTIWDPSRFAKDVLPRYFKHNKLGSFSQQLHTYGFRRRANSASHDSSIEFYHEHYRGQANGFIGWIRAGGAVSKRTTQIRPTPAADLPPQQLLDEMWQVQEGLKQLGSTFQQIKAAHATQIRTILTKLTLRGTLSPESASYLSSLPPVVHASQSHLQQPVSSAPMGWEGGIPIGTAHATSEDNLQAQLEALEAGLPPLVVSANHGSMNSGDLINDLHGEDALQMYVDSAPNVNGMSMGSGNFGFSHFGMGAMGVKDYRQQPYPVDVISSQLNGRPSGMAGARQYHHCR